MKHHWTIILLIAIVVCLAARVATAFGRLLAKDEALYWVWSRIPQLCYLDHPPMVAYIIHLGTRLFGATEIGVRFMTLIAGAVVLGMLMLLTQRLTQDIRATWWVGIIAVCSPMLNITGILALPDSPVLMFSMLALASAIFAARMPPSLTALSWWTIFGACCGAAFISKYTSLFLPFGVVLALLTHRDGRRHLARMSTWLAVIPPMLAVTSPILIWNAQHNWASFAFQLGHGLSAAKSDLPAGLLYLKHAGEFLGGQFLVATPVLFAIGIAALIWGWRRYSEQNLAWRIIICSATLPLVLFFLAAIRAGGEPNWPNFAYLPLTLLTIKFISETPEGLAHRLLPAGVIVALIGSIIILLPETVFVSARTFGFKSPGKLDDTFGWQDLAQQAQEHRLAHGDGKPIPLAGSTAEMAAVFAFYLPDQPHIDTISLGKREYAQDYFPNRPDHRRSDKMVLIGHPPGGAPKDTFEKALGFEQGKRVDIVTSLPSGNPRARLLTLVERSSEKTP